MGTEGDAGVVRAGALEVRPADRIALVGGQALILLVRKLELLAELLRRRGRVVAREELYATVWGGELRAGDRSVDVYVHRLRLKLEDALPGTRFIHTHTHFGAGYRLEPETPVAYERPGTDAERTI